MTTPESRQEIEQEIEQTRERLGATVKDQYRDMAVFIKNYNLPLTCQ